MTNTNDNCWMIKRVKESSPKYKKNMLEVEVKLKVNRTQIESKLIALGFNKASYVYEADTYYNSTHMDLKAADKALRLRRYKDMDTGIEKCILNFKGPKVDNTTMTREETEFEVPSLREGDTLLQGLGFTPAGGVEKERTSYIMDDITCCLDKVTGLGEYLEIEIMAEDSEYNKSIARICELLAKLDLSMEQSIQESYLCMLQN